MERKFSEQFQNLIGNNTAQRFMRLPESRGGYLTESEYGQVSAIDDRKIVPPKDGFIANYCEEY